MTTVEINSDNYRTVTNQGGIVFVFCRASSCGTCHSISPVFEEVAERHPRHVFATLDTLADDELTSSLEMKHVPALILFRDGIMLFKQAGSFDEHRLEDIIAQAEALDMDVVRAEVSTESSADSSK